MANHPSAEKRNRQRVKRTLRNKGITSAVRTTLKKARTAIASGDAAASAKVREAVSALSKAVTKGALHKKAASRTTARISSALHKSQSR